MRTFRKTIILKIFSPAGAAYMSPLTSYSFANLPNVAQNTRFDAFNTILTQFLSKRFNSRALRIPLDSCKKLFQRNACALCLPGQSIFANASILLSAALAQVATDLSRRHEQKQARSWKSQHLPCSIAFLQREQ